MGQDRMGQDLTEHTIYAFVHGGASTDSGVVFFGGMAYRTIYPSYSERT
jgi:hypothetical protein